jgi:flagellum-specific peptidoglycan hydrolase FlgJ
MPTEEKKKKASAASKKKKTATKAEEEEEEEEEEQQQPPKTPMAPPQKLPQITVARLLNETQLGVSMHKRIIQQMTTLRANDPQMFLQEMCKCLLHVLLEYKVRRHRASLFRVFVVVFIYRRRRRRRRVSTNDFKILDMNFLKILLSPLV